MKSILLSIVLLIPLIAVVVIVVSYVIVFSYLTRIVKDTMESKKKIKHHFPNMTRKELRTRRKTIEKYQRKHLQKRSVKIVRFVCTVGVFFLLLSAGLRIGTVPYMIYLGLCFLFLSVVAYLQPKYEEIKLFWEKYLKDNPDNLLNVYLFDESKLYRDIEKSRKYVVLLGISCLIFGVGVWLS
ncbi:hypothetical protein [Enterococcus gilvus]|uniref:hypothetical protein n=1 Tax=Enterococcus gilvus TaxID=160453 RepID=UPI001C8CC678|nr:hypothetical protein [Enterococcus gilvus]MBX8938916.1 hypothetical protein [Enterococcus gilvus]